MALGNAVDDHRLRIIFSIDMRCYRLHSIIHFSIFNVVCFIDAFENGKTVFTVSNMLCFDLNRYSHPTCIFAILDRERLLSRTDNIRFIALFDERCDSHIVSSFET